MKKFLIIHDPNTGYTQLANVGIMYAENEEEAKERYIKKFGFIEEVRKKLDVTIIDDIGDDWFYYTR